MQILGVCLAHSRSGAFGDEKSLMALPGIESRFVRYSASGLVTLSTTLG